MVSPRTQIPGRSAFSEASATRRGLGLSRRFAPHPSPTPNPGFSDWRPPPRRSHSPIANGQFQSRPATRFETPGQCAPAPSNPEALPHAYWGPQLCRPLYRTSHPPTY
ncbi:uncharacterized protein B0H18DRAFT_607077 [Fomitopsis serialis]|uniref:uncharacterized protein n=1 Tax=Fomitopsis serialis TaxID=139415 RepID=UPI0020075F3A|nr:uncharacterized protein B0H18DRAFT_607077 [Neoantrodia serialis]KAH9920273.1 hypothetical protein B0H18DRAFT_607077 [Neoantrodia serialis]